MTQPLEVYVESASPKPFAIPNGKAALVIIDMQRDFVADGGYGMYQCPSRELFQQVSSIVTATRAVLDKAREVGLTVIHTREGHAPGLLDCHASKRLRQKEANPQRHKLCIGDKGPMGDLLVRGSHGHGIIDELQPFASEVILDKPAKGSFCNTNFYQILTSRGITHIFLCGVTTECCVATTFKEANDRGFECCVLTDCTEGFNEQIVGTAKNMFSAYDGLFGYTCTSTDCIGSLCQMAAKGAVPAADIEALYEHYTNYASMKPVKDIQAISYQSHIEDQPALHGMTYFISSSVSEISSICDLLNQKGAILLGTVNDASKFVPRPNTFLLSIDTEGFLHSKLDACVFTPTYGSISTAGLTMVCPSFDKIAIIGSSAGDCRKVWTELLSTAPTDPYSVHYRAYPTPAIDYRGPLADLRLGVFPIHSESKSYLHCLERLSVNNKPKMLSAEAFREGADLGAILHDQERDILDNPDATYGPEISGRKLSAIRHKWLRCVAATKEEFESGRIHALLVPRSPEYLRFINSLGLCAISSKTTEACLVTSAGLDWRIMDIAEKIDM